MIQCGPSMETWLSALEIADLVRRKEVKPLEVLDAILARLEAVNPILNAFCLVTADAARVAAREAEIAVMKGEPLGRLHGVPVSVKDVLPTRGLTTTGGSRLFADFVPEEDALAVGRLKAAGAVLLGKTNTSEFGHKAFTESPLFGITRNPWDPSLTPGGSSGGGAAAVASGVGPVALGTDGGGSIRIPAAFCGAVRLEAVVRARAGPDRVRRLRARQPRRPDHAHGARRGARCSTWWPAATTATVARCRARSARSWRRATAT